MLKNVLTPLKIDPKFIFEFRKSKFFKLDKNFKVVLERMSFSSYRSWLELSYRL